MSAPAASVVREERTGLSGAEAVRRLAEHGRNEIQRGETRSAWGVLLEQFRSPMIALLLGACAVSALLGEHADAIAIGAIVVINALIGFAQESRAERALLALRSMTAPRARVMRDGYAVQLPAAEVVPGDVLLLEAGDIVAADARLAAAGGGDAGLGDGGVHGQDGDAHHGHHGGARGVGPGRAGGALHLGGVL